MLPFFHLQVANGHTHAQYFLPMEFHSRLGSVLSLPLMPRKNGISLPTSSQVSYSCSSSLMHPHPCSQAQSSLPHQYVEHLQAKMPTKSTSFINPLM